MTNVKYPKPRVERKEQASKPPLEAEKYQKIVESHPPEVTAVTRREKRIKDLGLDEKSKIEKQLEKQSLLARVLQAVKKW